MKQSNSMKIWNILYPIAMYYVITTLTLFVLDFILPETIDTKLFRQLITSLAAVPFLYTTFVPKQKLYGKEIKQYILMFIAGGCFAIAWNNILGMMRIIEYSVSYQQVEETFYTGRVLLEILALCIVIPIVEELLYRGIVYGKIREWLGVKAAILGSAVIFGLVHMNLVQFVYASVFGILLAVFAEKTGDLMGAFAAHMAANLTSVLRAETDVLQFIDNNRTNQIIVTGILLLAALASLYAIYKLSDTKQEGRG